MLCDDLEGWNGAATERETHEGGDICTQIADSLHCTAEPNATLQSNYTPIKIKTRANKTVNFFKLKHFK